MRIGFIGSGNVATLFAKALFDAGHTIAEIFSPNLLHARELAKKVNAKPIGLIEDLSGHYDLLIIAIKDGAISRVASTLPEMNGVVVHTAGSVGMDVLKRFTHHGVLYPFQTITKNKANHSPAIPLFIESNTTEGETLLFQIGKGISSYVQKATSLQRGHLHLTAVFANNFVNHLFVVSKHLIETEGLDFDLLKPLIKETLEKVMTSIPEINQTGPAIRFDQQTIEKHLHWLNEEPTYQQIYKIMTSSIQSMHKKSDF